MTNKISFNTDDENDDDDNSSRTSSTRANNPNKKFICEYNGCLRRYTTAGNLKTHQKTHFGNYPFLCNEKNCNKGFLTSYALKIHLRVHTKEKPYKCKVESCLKSFNTLYRLKAHIRIHSGNTFDCKICSKVFTTQSDLRKHFRIHSGEKPFRCSIQGCKKSFAVSHHLRNHFFTHTTDKPYKCEESFCGKRFKSHASLVKHIKTLHKKPNKSIKSIQINVKDKFYLSNVDSQSLGMENNESEKFQIKFDSSNGIMTINSIYPISTQIINKALLKVLIERLQENNQLILNENSICSQFYVDSDVLSLLLYNERSGIDAQSSMYLNFSSQIF